jgi:type IV secretion system protein VirB3
MDTDETPPQEFISYNGLGRSPTIWGIPYMFGLFFCCGALVVAMVCGLTFGPLGWLVGALAIPVLFYVKLISETDDKAIRLVAIEMKWFLIKFFRGNAKYFGGTMTIAPISYGRKFKYVKRYFENAIER